MNRPGIHAKKARLIVAGLSLLGMQHAGADDAAPLAKAEVVGHYDSDSAVGTSDAASQGTVTAELIRNRPALRTGELLEFVPGMIVTQHSGDGKANQYFLRGFNLDRGTDFALSSSTIRARATSSTRANSGACSA